MRHDSGAHDAGSNEQQRRVRQDADPGNETAHHLDPAVTVAWFDGFLISNLGVVQKSEMQAISVGGADQTCFDEYRSVLDHLGVIFFHCECGLGRVECRISVVCV